MEYNVYVIYDARSNRYTQPMCFDNDAVAVRDFVTEASRPYTRTHEFPEDYVLYNIGIFYEATGEIISSKPERVCSLNEYIVKEKK